MRFLNRIKEDKGVSHAISFMVIMAFIMVMLISFIDVGLYFNTKNQMMSAAENGARSVALYGGVDNAVTRSKGNTNPIDLTWDSIPNNYKGAGMRTVIVNRSGVVCHPGRTNQRIYAGDEVWCEVTYIYNGIAGRFGLFNLGKGSNVNNRSMTVRGTSVSEVTIN